MMIMVANKEKWRRRLCAERGGLNDRRVVKIEKKKSERRKVVKSNVTVVWKGLKWKNSWPHSRWHSVTWNGIQWIRMKKSGLDLWFCQFFLFKFDWVWGVNKQIIKIISDLLQNRFALNYLQASFLRCLIVFLSIMRSFIFVYRLPGALISSKQFFFLSFFLSIFLVIVCYYAINSFMQSLFHCLVKVN